ncbi:MAG: substrate-binding domain-containing protein [Victivallales bacterium]|nr:substrate-binding domain-containing protein [Victivallales bacterium]
MKNFKIKLIVVGMAGVILALSTVLLLKNSDSGSIKSHPYQWQKPNNVLSGEASLPVRETNNKEAPFVIGVLYWSMNIPGQVAMRKGLEAQAEEINANSSHEKPVIILKEYVAGDGVAGMERQIRQMHELIDGKVDLIIVQPTDIAALREPLIRANKEKIPVIAYDQHIIDGQLACYITSDNYQAGYLDGEYVAANFPQNKKLRIILVEYPHVSSTVKRVDGFIDALEQYEQAYEIIKSYNAVEPEGGREAGAEILRDFPEPGSFDVIFTVNDGGGLAILQALDAAGRKEVFFASVDGDPISVMNIKKGNIMRIDSAQFCGVLGSESMKMAYRLLKGERIPRQVLIPSFPITRETVDMYKGWNAPMPEPFKKPWHSNTPEWSGKPRIINAQEDANHAQRK